MNQPHAPMPWIDVTVPIHPDLPGWPGQPPVSRTNLSAIAEGDVANVSHLSLSVHTGTHIDAPLHFLASGADVTTAPLDVLIGPARVLAVPDVPRVEVQHLQAAGIGIGERLLLKTDNSAARWDQLPFQPDAIYLSTDAADYLAQQQTLCIGIDYLSVAGYQKNEALVHLALLQAGIWIIEGLWLRDVAPGLYQMLCLPLKITGSDGAPARVVLQRM